MAQILFYVPDDEKDGLKADITTIGRRMLARGLDVNDPKRGVISLSQVIRELVRREMEGLHDVKTIDE
jgi:hypothetical protein